MTKLNNDLYMMLKKVVEQVKRESSNSGTGECFGSKELAAVLQDADQLIQKNKHLEVKEVKPMLKEQKVLHLKDRIEKLEEISSKPMLRNHAKATYMEIGRCRRELKQLLATETQ